VAAAVVDPSRFLFIPAIIEDSEFYQEFPIVAGLIPSPLLATL
jgi:hypothetical protein